MANASALGYGLVKVRGIGAELGRVREVWIPLSESVTALRYRYPEVDPDELIRQNPRTRRSLAASVRVRRHYFSGELAEAQRRATAAIPRASDPASQERIRLAVGALGQVSQPAIDAQAQLEELLRALDGDDASVVEARRAGFIAADRRTQEVLGVAARAIEEGLGADASSAEDRAQSSLVALGLLTAIATAFGLVAIAIVGRALQPIGDLTAFVKRISAGEFGQRVTVATGDEIGILANEFNQMAASLRSRDERVSRLSAYNENVLESVRVGILVADGSGLVTGMNRAAEEIWGITRGELVGRPIGAFGDAAAFAERIEQVRAGGPAVRIGATALASGRSVEVSAVPFMEDGRANGVVVVAEDVSERVRVERQLLAAERLAAIGRMSSQITHEVRNPLNSLSLNVELLEEEIDGREEGAKGLLRAIAREIERLTEITEGYLTFARLPRPKLEPEQVNAVVQELVQFVREEAESSGVSIRTELIDGVPSVLADENQLRQALLNIVRNALDALREKGGGGLLRIATRPAETGVEVTLSDDGPGIQPKDLARIFDPFYSTKASGTGLGLPLTQQIIVEHGGTIACASEPGRGTTFTIRLPAA